MPVDTYPVAETLSELKKLRHKLDGTRVAPRIDMLIVFRSRQAAEMSTASELLDVPVRTLRRWWKIYRDGGIGELLGERNHTVEAEHGISEPGVSSDRSIPEHVVAMLNALPDRVQPMEWIDQFRSALIALFGDIDRITIYFDSVASLEANSARRPAMMVIHHIGEENRRGRTSIATSKMSGEPSRQILASMKVDGFPIAHYHPPHLYDYHRGDGTYLGSMILWRNVRSTPVSRKTLAMFASLEPFFRFMISDFIARQQAAQPELRGFTERVAQISRDHGLSVRERDVIIHYLVGRSYKEIADHLAVSISTVRKHIEAIHTKTGVKTTAQLVARFFAPLRERV